jgi:hypothetical protein
MEDEIDVMLFAKVFGRGSQGHRAGEKENATNKGTGEVLNLSQHRV